MTIEAVARHVGAGAANGDGAAGGNVFDAVFAALIGHEGGFTDELRDNGNWTGGRCFIGECKGTKFGISAAAYPLLDIKGLTVEAARAIYRRDYWDRVGGDALPPALALLVFDAAVNNGVERAVRWLQGAAGAPVDGRMGPRTLAAVAARARDWRELVVEFQAQRLNFMAALPTWRVFGLGWSRRLARLPLQALALADGAAA